MSILVEVDVVRRGKWDGGKFFELEIDALQWDIEDLETVAEARRNDTDREVLNRIKDAAIARLRTEGHQVSRAQIRVDGYGAEVPEASEGNGDGPEPIRSLYKGKPIRPKHIPRNQNGKLIMREIQDSFRLKNTGFTSMRIVLQLTSPMGNTNRLQYWLLAWEDEEGEREFQSSPEWTIPITTTETVLNNIGKHYAVTVDLTDDANSYLMVHRRLLVAVALVRTSSATVNIQDAGRIERAVIKLN